MTPAITLLDVRRAQSACDPGLARLVVTLASASDPAPERPVREGAPTAGRWFSEIRSRRFSRLPIDERARLRIDGMRQIEAEDAEVPLPDRWRLDTVIMALSEDGSPWARRQLLEIIAEVPLRYGPWRAIKQLFKAAEANSDLELFGAIAARLDHSFAQRRWRADVSRRTVGYLVRRAWRFLRRLAESMPAVYPDAAVEVLRFYPDDTQWRATWIANHIFYHGTGEYSRRRFRLRRRPSTLLKHRAFAELWRRTPRPLFALLEQAEADQCRRYAVDALKSDFRAALREVEPAWVARLVGVRSEPVHSFVVWLLDNVPRFEQGALREAGLHDAALALLDSPADAARIWAAQYARTHARDLALDALIRHVDNEQSKVRAMARDLLAARDPRDEIGLHAWGRLLASGYAHDFAAAALRKHFTARELTPAWFRARLLADSGPVVGFAIDALPRIHPPKDLGSPWFIELLEADALHQSDQSWRSARFALDMLEKLPADAQDAETRQRLVLNPLTRDRARAWIEAGRWKAETLGVDFLKAIADEPTWNSDPTVHNVSADGPSWARELTFDPALARFALDLLRDVRIFDPDALGFAWLLGMVQRTDETAHDFAVEYMTKAFVPADFAPKDEADDGPADSGGDGEINVDLEGASFLFTGKLATMTRGVAQKKVIAANGTNIKAVSGKLDYLVIGDEGSPLYGGGRKGSKQVKAEKLRDGGAGIRIISETAFLQMLAGKQRKVDDDSTERGCEALWAMLTAPEAPDGTLARFARHYLRRHHVDICPLETDRYVDPGAEIPEGFLDFERVRTLLADSRPGLRALGIEFARWSMAAWAPPMAEIVALCELPHADLRAFLVEILTAEASPEAKRYRLDPSMLTPEAVYRFCESTDATTRALGMRLIAAHPRLAVPEELFRLTESPDRQVRAFVVAQLWRLYRDRGITGHWRPSAPPASTIGRRQARPVDIGEGPPPRPAALPATPDDLRGFLRRTLFGIPPARLPRDRSHSGPRLKPLSAHLAKKALVEVIRDLAIDDRAFAALVTPLLRVFTGSRGLSERAACLVALARIRAAHPDLSEEAA